MINKATMFTFLAILIVIALQIVILVRVFSVSWSSLTIPTIKSSAEKYVTITPTIPLPNIIEYRTNSGNAVYTEPTVSPVEPTTETEPIEPIVSPIEPKVSPTFYTVALDCQIHNLPQIYGMVFGKRKNGTFVEFGAYDGATVSNTCGLADIGWIGLYIEPVPEFAERCRLRHQDNRVTVVQSAVGPENLENVSLTIGGPLSTMHSATQSAYEQIDWAKGSFTNKIEIQVPQKLLGDILTEQKIQPSFELMVVDIEGYEWEALRNFDLKMWNPTMVIIELEDAHESFRDADADVRSKFTLLRQYFESSGYVTMYKDSINTIYVRSSVME